MRSLLVTYYYSASYIFAHVHDYASVLSCCATSTCIPLYLSHYIYSAYRLRLAVRRSYPRMLLPRPLRCITQTPRPLVHGCSVRASTARTAPPCWCQLDHHSGTHAGSLLARASCTSLTALPDLRRMSHGNSAKSLHVDDQLLRQASVIELLT